MRIVNKCLINATPHNKCIYFIVRKLLNIRLRELIDHYQERKLLLRMPLQNIQ